MRRSTSSGEIPAPCAAIRIAAIEALSASSMPGTGSDMSVWVAVGSGDAGRAGLGAGSATGATRRCRRAASSAARLARGLCGRMPACRVALADAFARTVGWGRWAARRPAGVDAADLASGAGAGGGSGVGDAGATTGASAGFAAGAADVVSVAEADSSGVERRRARSPEARAAPAATEGERRAAFLGEAFFAAGVFGAAFFVAALAAEGAGAFFVATFLVAALVVATFLAVAVFFVVAISAALPSRVREPVGPHRPHRSRRRSSRRTTGRSG